MIKKKRLCEYRSQKSLISAGSHISVDFAPAELLERAREGARVSVALLVVQDINPLHLARFNLLARFARKLILVVYGLT